MSFVVKGCQLGFHCTVIEPSAPLTRGHFRYHVCSIHLQAHSQDIPQRVVKKIQANDVLTQFLP